MDSKQRTKSKSTNHRTKQNHWHEMNRKERRELMRKIQSEELSLEVIHPDAAGIDIGNESHYVAVPPSRDSQSVRRFGCTTAELKRWPRRRPSAERERVSSTASNACFRNSMY